MTNLNLRMKKDSPQKVQQALIEQSFGRKTEFVIFTFKTNSF